MSGEQPRAQEHHGQPWPLADDITLTQLHRSMVELSRSTTAWFQQANRRFDVLHEELALIRSDHGPRITAVEKSAMSKAKTAAGWTGVVSLVLTLAAQLAAMYNPKMVGPIQAIAQMFGGQ